MQSFGLGALILLPLLYTQALPVAIFRSLLIVPAAPAASAPPRAPAPVNGKHLVRFLENGKIHEPIAIPSKIRMIAEAELPPELAPSGDAAAGADILQGLAPTAARAVPAPPAAPVTATPPRLSVMATIEAAKLIAQTQPVYPVLALQARIQGNVILHAVITKDGRVSELQVVSGDPRLVKSALDAVVQWRYQPTLLNGQPVEVETTITVSFVLGA